MKSTNERLVITFERNYDEKELKKRFGIEYPMYFQYYEDALTAILKNIESNTIRDKDAYGSQNENYGMPLHSSNIIAFAGSRGTGKTTALTEFSRILENYYSSCDEWNKEIYYRSGRQYRFHVLPLIDASVLSAKEDLIEVILASMYQMANKKQGACKQENFDREDGLFRKIIAKFDSVYKDYLNVGNLGEQTIPGDSVLVKLRNVSDSLKTKVAFEKLAESFLELLDDGRKNEDDSYLVVVIDDLDMNPRSGFAMLDQIYKYFSNRRVIVLIAVKYEQMYLLSQKNFVDGLIPEFGSTHYKVYKKYERKARSLANDYLLKALPLANRIYLPEGSRLYQEARIAEGEFGQKLSVKEFLLRKIAEKTNIYYDAHGLKKHFCQPDTVRELVSYNAFLDSLFSLEEIEQQGNVDGRKQMVLYDQNHERFNMDIEERMAVKLLNDDQLEIYQLIMERHVERRAGYMLCFIRNWLANKDYGKKDRRPLEDSVDELDFSYSDLIGALYQLGRKDYEDKVLVHCILASFTSEMVREYYSYLHNTEKAKECAAKSLKSFLGTTFGGNWLEEVMPAVIMDMGQYKAYLSACYIGSVSVQDFEIKIDKVGLNWENTEEWLTEVLLENLPYVECISLLFANAKNEAGRMVSPQWEFSIDKRDKTEDGTKAVLTVKGHVGSADFDMFGFLGREIRTEADATVQNDTIFQALEQCAFKYCEEHGEPDAKEKIRRTLKGRARKNSIWYKSQGSIAFPYYDFDMAYNIVKRVRRKMAGSTFVSTEQICECYRTVYGYMAHSLHKEEQYYKNLYAENGSRRVPELYANFMNCPFIRAFGVQYEGEKLPEEGIETRKILDREKLNNYLVCAVKSLSVNVAQIEAEEEPE